MAGHVHIVGGGLAGLSAAVELAGSGVRVSVYEAGPACGGRARSYYDRQLDCRIDNGNHLLLSANDAVFRYLGLIGAERSLVGPGRPIFPFVDLGDRSRWTLDLSRGRLPFWLLSRRRRVPGMRLGEIRSLTRLMQAGADQTVSDCLLPGMLSARLLAPFAVSALNTPCETGSAALLGAVIRDSLAKGGQACIPCFPAVGLSESFVDPALDHLALLKAEIRTGCRVSGIEVTGGRIASLRLPEGAVPVGPDDAVIMAAPAPVAADLLSDAVPGLPVPDAFESILNVHFRLPQAPVALGTLAQARFIGVVGGISEWVFVKGDILSVTVSAANRYADRGNDDLAARIWDEVRAAIDPALAHPLPADMPPMRVVRERRATFAATPAQERLRPGTRTVLDNLFLAGDWTATGLPATIEGAIRSGAAAVRAFRARDMAGMPAG
ncbi:squalene-associated FAD-dependent desaturase [Gluconacetobacter diazotrophicus PA1 5]|uniref:Putative amine oxidase n=1 Tax=Gluconacetobacter diazotrophicus (strain ATCC 49037 / DSM 5601 / CCUG 37298 / CIP 103539 / LMG 7603 / PAl5) TaxID=272568 RepID=A9HGY5_GLUDA|nr:hydroxysqualene dehydroxylase HpnE [Gluconacetobacter diazotrophicus]ACI51586.1 squalene-associated FAD-dependent desaturase [Gluconacetobacter diazotrophicus PA1 5]TWB03425.1 squalene-associated FAD-dependent desaturase [Gluconacetobacter diazotrophicus]CAP55564.1 putative amine oxidase [Gluconacetobacter diazotrophicus PA1 5]